VSREEKLHDRIANNPRDVRPDDLFDVLRSHGIRVKRLAAGSHVGLSRGGTWMTLAVPHDAGQLKTPYVTRALKTFCLEHGHEAAEEGTCDLGGGEPHSPA